jgi:hypothetical protein
MEISVSAPGLQLQRRSKKHPDKPFPAWKKNCKASNWCEPYELANKIGYSQFCGFAINKLIPQLSLAGRKITRKQELLCGMLYQLLYTGLRCRLVRDTRNTSERGVKLRTALWNLLIAQEWCEIYTGSRREKVWTRYEAKPSLLHYLPYCSEIFRSEPLARNSNSPDNPVRHAVVFAHSGKRDLQTGKKLPESERCKPLPFPHQDEPLFNYLCLLEDSVTDINQKNGMHDWRVQLSPGVWVSPEVSLRQTHVGEWNRAPRLHTSGILSAQSLKKSIRRTMTIDGEETIELDFSSMVPRMAYHSLGIEASGDIYRCEEVFPSLNTVPRTDEFRNAVRPFLKRAMNTMFNVATKGAAKKAVAYNGRHYLSVEGFRWFFQKSEGLNFSRLVDRIEEVHPQIRKLFYCNTGMDLMTSEAFIMLFSLMDITASGRPALGIHDAIVCKASDADFVKSTMAKNYDKYFPGFPPEINRSR